MQKLKNYIPLLLIILLAAVYFSTLGFWEIFRPAIYGSAFDSLAQNLLRLSAEVDPEAIGNEAMVINSKYFMYYGPFPALLRLILNLINPENYGNWTCFSKLLAYFTSLTFFGKICLLALNQNNKLHYESKSNLNKLSILMLAFASPIFYLLIHNTIYAECISWGLSFSIAAIYFYLKDLNQSNNFNLMALGICTGLAILAKLTYALPLCLLIIYKFFKEQHYSKPKLLAYLTPLLILGCFQLWYNQARFGNLWQVYNAKARSINAQNPAKVRSYKLALLDPKRIPEELIFYFSIDFEQVINKNFPYIKVYRNKIEDINKYTINAAIFPLSLSSTGFLITALLGFIAVIRRKEDLVPISFFSLQSLVALSFSCISYRYTVELVPLLVYLHFFFLLDYKNFKPEKLCYLLAISVLLFNAYCTIFSSITRTALYDRSGKEKIRARYFLREAAALKFKELGHKFLN